MRFRKHLEQTIGFDYWCTFNYQMESKPIRVNNQLNYAAQVLKKGQHNILPDPNLVSYNHIDRGKKALHNYFIRLARLSRQHIFLLYGGDYQPENNQPHFHTSIKFEKEKLPLDGSYSFLDEWLYLNPSSTSNRSATGEAYDNNRAGIDYQESHSCRGYIVACPKRKRECKNNNCKGVEIFKLSPIV